MTSRCNLACLLAALAWFALACVDTTAPWLKRLPRDAGVPSATRTATATATTASEIVTSTATSTSETQTATATSETLTSTATATSTGSANTATVTSSSTKTSPSDGTAATGVATSTKSNTKTAVDAGVDAVVDARPVADAVVDAPLDVAVDRVPMPKDGLIVYYSFDQIADNTVADLSGNSRTGMLNGQCSLTTGVVNKALSLTPSTTDAGSGYVTLPGTWILSTNAMTIAVWIRLENILPWQRVFHFGLGANGNAFMFLAVNTPQTGGMRFAIQGTTDAGLIQPTIDGPALPAKTWKHVAVVLTGTAGRVYVDGVLAASNTNIPLRPSDLGETAGNWIGKSQFSWDPTFDGQVDEFRIYNRALSASEIAVLATP